jgi:hypothetical protein
MPKVKAIKGGFQISHTTREVWGVDDNDAPAKRMRPAGFSVDVPITLTVAVRGEDLTEEQAFEIARDYAHSLQPSQHETDGYNSAAFGSSPRHYITEVSLESSTEESCEVIEELEPEPEDS